MKLEYKSDHWVQRYFLMANFIRDPLMALFIVFLHDYPMIQLGSISSLFFTLLFASLKFRPFKCKFDNFKLIFSSCTFCFLKVLYLILIVGENSISSKNQSLLIGNLMILCIVVLFGVEIVVGGYVAYKDFKEARELKKKMNKEKEDAKKIPSQDFDNEESEEAPGENNENENENNLMEEKEESVRFKF